MRNGESSNHGQPRDSYISEFKIVLDLELIGFEFELSPGLDRFVDF